MYPESYKFLSIIIHENFSAQKPLMKWALTPKPKSFIKIPKP